VCAGTRRTRPRSTTSEIAEVERLIAAEALPWPEVKRLMTVPGVNVIVAATFMKKMRRLELAAGAARRHRIL
jgi:hypothetical protein